MAAVDPGVSPLRTEETMSLEEENISGEKETKRKGKEQKSSRTDGHRQRGKVGGGEAPVSFPSSSPA
jgi:hypothetical protein